MPTFKYHITPNPNGGFTTRPVLGNPVSSDHLITLIAAKAGTTPEAITTALLATRDTILECAQDCAHTHNLLGWLRFRPTSGGSQPSPDAFDTPDEINAGIALSLTADTITHWRTTLTLQSQGEIGKATPYIASTTNLENNTPDRYTPGAMIEISGHDLRFDKTDPAQGLFIRTGNTAETRLTTYGPITPSSVIALIPPGTTGPQTLRIAAHLYGSIRTFTYQTPLT